MMEKLKFYWSKTNRWHRITLIFLLGELKLIPGSQLGFYCNDPDLSYTFKGDTITWKWLLAITVLLPLPVMLAVERKYHKEGNDLKRYKRYALRWYREYLFGLMINLTVVQVLKLLVGAPRPHFFDTCRPKEAESCLESQYVSSYTCTKAHWLSQSDRSFPSGHTSMALHCAVFLAWYLHRRISLLRPHPSPAVQLSQALLMMTAIFCAVSRIMDRRHHIRDVMAGTAIAVPVLWYTIYTLCKNFYCSVSTKSEKLNEEKPSNGLDIPQETVTSLTS